MNINSILKSKTLAELLDAIDDFCRNSFIRENDDEIMNLKEQVDEITDNDYIVMLSAYMCAAEDGDEVIEALYEFVSNCKGFVEPDEDLTQQVTKEEFEEGLRKSAVNMFDSQVDELSKMNINERVSYYNKHNISLINRAFYEEYVEKKIAEAGDVNPEEQAEAIKQKEQKAKDDQDYFDIIECGQNPPGPNYISAEEAIAMDKADEGMGTE